MERSTVEKNGELLIKNADSEYRSPCYGCESIRRCDPKKKACSFYEALKRLKEYEDLDEQGKLLKDPEKLKHNILALMREFEYEFRYYSESCIDYHGGKAEAMEIAVRIVKGQFSKALNVAGNDEA